jgi:hypothetical protein
MAEQNFGGLLFGQGGSGLEEYLSPAQQQAIQQQGMLSAAAALLSASGERPVGQGIGFGQALGSALQAGQQGYSQAQTGAIQTLMAQQKLREAKIDADIKAKMAAEQSGEQPVGLSPDDAKFNTYMKYSDVYAKAGKLKEAKDLQDLAYQIKPRAEVTGAPFEVTGADNKPLLVQQMKDGSIKTVEGYGPKRDVVLQNLGGRTVAIDKSKLTGGESFSQTLAPQVVGGAETGYYVVGGGGGGAAPAPAAGGQRTATPPVGSTIMRPDYRPAPSAPAGQVVPPVGVPAANGLTPIIAGTGPKPTEQYNKMALGVLNTSNAVNNFVSRLEGFGASDMFDPARRAELNSAHSNAMLQAKELYNLGVLTGGDEEILNKVLANPVDFKSSLTPVSAIKKQAEDLQTVINNANKNLSTVFKQPELTIPKPPEKPVAKPAALQEGMTGTSKSGQAMIVRNGIWEYVK